MSRATCESWTEEQQGLLDFLAGVMRGHHHVRGNPKKWGRGIKISLPDDRFATFDFDQLTRLVVRAHDAMVRVQIVASSPGRIGLILHQRNTREGAMHTRHPTIEQAIEAHRIKARKEAP